MQEKKLREKFQQWLLDKNFALNKEEAKTLAEILGNFNRACGPYGVSIWYEDRDKIGSSLALMFKNGVFKELHYKILLLARYLTFMEELLSGAGKDSALSESFSAFNKGEINEYDLHVRLLTGVVYLKMDQWLTPEGEKALGTLTKEEKDWKIYIETRYAPSIVKREGKRCVMASVDADNGGELQAVPFLAVLFKVFQEPGVDVVVRSEKDQDAEEYVLDADGVRHLVDLIDSRVEHAQNERSSYQDLDLKSAESSKTGVDISDPGVDLQVVDEDLWSWNRREDCVSDRSQKVWILIYNLRESSAYSYFRHQKEVPTIRGLRLVNNTRQDLDDLKILITSLDTNVFKDKEFKGEGNTFSLQRGRISKEMDISLGLNSFDSINRNGALDFTRINIKVVQGDKMLGEVDTKVWILPKFFCEFEFINELPRFVLLRDPVIYELEKETSDILSRTTGSGDQKGYQGGKEHVLEMCKAAYEAIRTLRPSYANPPASGNNLNGQRLRIPSVVKKYHLGTCMDMTLLYAALVEQFKLYPILVMKRDRTGGHIFCGVWLDPYAHDRINTYLLDKTQLLVHCKRKQLFFVECTGMCGDRGFEKAILDGDEISDNSFERAIDVENARRADIRELPIASGDWNFNDDMTEVEVGVPSESAERPHRSSPRLDSWVNDLLDLDPEKNPLLDLGNCGDDTPAIPFFTADIVELEARWAEKKVFAVAASTDDWLLINRTRSLCTGIVSKLLKDAGQGGVKEELNVFSRFPFEAAVINDKWDMSFYRNGLNERFLPLPPLNSNSLNSLLRNIKQTLQLDGSGDPNERERAKKKIIEESMPEEDDGPIDVVKLGYNLINDRLLELKSDRSSFEKLLNNNKESGSSSLYMCLGVLRWRAPDEKVDHYSPLILEPIDIEKNEGPQYCVKPRKSGEIHFNRTLTAFMKEKFDIDLSDLDPVPRKGAEVDAAVVFNAIRDKISAYKSLGWDVLEICAICAAGDLRFEDLEIRLYLRALGNDRLLENPIVAAIVHEDRPFQQNWDEDEIAKVPVEMTFPYDDAQRKAVQAALSGLDFALIGGSGVGKKGAVANILANAISKKKRILVVSEDNKFLDQIKGTLDECGLSDFTLSLYDAETKDALCASISRSLEDIEKLGKDRNSKVEKYKTGEDLKRLYAGLSYGDLRTEAGDWLYDLCVGLEKLDAVDDPLKLECADAQRMSISEVETTFYEKFVNFDFLGKNWDWEKDAKQGRKFSQIGIRLAEIDDELKEKLNELARGYLTALKIVKRFGSALAQQIRGRVGEFPELQTKRDYSLLDDALKYYQKNNASEAVYSIFEDSELINKLNLYYFNAAKLGRMRSTMGYDWLDYWTIGSKMFAFPAKAFVDEYEKADADAQQALIDELNALAKGAVSLESLSKFLDELMTYQEDYKSNEEYRAKLPELCLTALERWDSSSAFDAAKNEYNKFKKYTGNDARKTAIAIALREVPNIEAYCEAYSAVYAQYAEAEKKFSAALEREISEDENAIAEEITFCELIMQSSEKSKLWIDYVSAKEKCVELGMRALIEECEKNWEQNKIFNTRELYDRFKKGFYEAAIDAIVFGADWNEFSRMGYERQFENYRESFGKYLNSTAKEIAKNRAKDFIDRQRSALFRRSASDFRLWEDRQCTVREFVANTWDFLFDFCSCVLATPQNVAAYFPQSLDPEKKFDLAIVGNADQLHVAKALGAIARSNHTIVVADRGLMDKQLDERSLYAAFSGVCRDKLRLTRHYRSKNGVLTAYTNKKMYDGRLIAAPAFYDPERRVEAVLVHGDDFDEAAAVCAETLRRYKNKTLRKHTFAIVAFSKKQWTLLERLLNKLKENDREFKAWFERYATLQRLGMEPNAREFDALLISPGNLASPVNDLQQANAKVRFCRVLTRAKESIVVFSTKKSRDVSRLINDDAEGLAALYDFMVYAETGRLSFLTSGDDTKPLPADGLTRGVCQAVEDAGFGYELQAGTADLAIDVAVVDKELKGLGYVLGILFEGVGRKTWRENLQRYGMLKDSGWKRLYQVYLPEYLKNKEKAIAELSAYLLRVKEELKKEKAPRRRARADAALVKALKPLWKEFEEDDDLMDEIRRLEEEE